MHNTVKQAGQFKTASVLGSGTSVVVGVSEAEVSSKGVALALVELAFVADDDDEDVAEVAVLVAVAEFTDPLGGFFPGTGLQ